MALYSEPSVYSNGERGEWAPLFQIGEIRDWQWESWQDARIAIGMVSVASTRPNTDEFNRVIFTEPSVLLFDDADYIRTQRFKGVRLFRPQAYDLEIRAFTNINYVNSEGLTYDTVTNLFVPEQDGLGVLAIRGEIPWFHTDLINQTRWNTHLYPFRKVLR